MVGQCCATGSLHAGTPQGNVRKVHGLDCYVAEPNAGPPPKGIVVIFPDIFGWTMPNTRLLADRYAAKGRWTVYLPEFMDGHAAPTSLLASLDALDGSGATKAWHLMKVLSFFMPFKFYARDAVMRPRIFDFLHALRKNEAQRLPIGVAGFCWGGKRTTILSHNTNPELVDATYTAHPSELDFPADIEKVVKPTSIAAGTLDNLFFIEQADKAEAILKAKTEKGEGVHEVVRYEGAKHGFAIKGSEDDEKERERSVRAEEQAVAWFEGRFAECRY
ncbi:alpha/beta-hydrolase [Lophiostoma macrostomum CBS 122681]|uniref:Alpha/beta-hydrolase n=1 Tax=Lophiostoma macrostomum CBS 122681 TaxID=1314788 RepID=A0A6A6T606_9PLEO|nr:alpha/beta-hydrolase [Lophiostoma macrostomum CBS 122681]